MGLPEDPLPFEMGVHCQDRYFFKGASTPEKTR